MKMFRVLAVLSAMMMATPALAQLTPDLGRSIDADGHVKNDTGVVIRPDKSGAAPTITTSCGGAACATEATLAALSAKIPATLGAKTGATSLSVVPASDATFAATQSGAWLNGVKGADGSTIASSTNGLPIIGTKLNDGTQSSTGGTHLTMGGIDTGTNVYRPLLVDSSGRINITDGSGTANSLTVDSAQLAATLGIKTSALSPSFTPASDASFSITDGSGVASSITVDNATASNLNAQVVGDIAAAATDSGKPVKVGCFAQSTAQAAATNGQRQNLWCGLNGQMFMTLYDAGNALSAQVVATGVDNASNSVNGLNVHSAGKLYNAATWERMRSIVGAVAAGTGNTAVTLAPMNIAAGAIVPGSSSAAEGSHIACGAACNVYRVSVTTGGTAGYITGFNATSAPADGAVTPVLCRAVAANSTLSISYADMPSRWSTGATFVFSSTGCFTKTISATAFFEWSVM